MVIFIFTDPYEAEPWLGFKAMCKLEFSAIAWRLSWCLLPVPIGSVKICKQYSRGNQFKFFLMVRRSVLSRCRSLPSKLNNTQGDIIRGENHCGHLRQGGRGEDHDQRRFRGRACQSRA